MKKLLGVLLCFLLAFSSVSALAQGAPWLTPLKNMIENQQNPENVFKQTAQIQLSTANYFNAFQDVLSQSPDAQIYKMVINQYGSALDALMGALKFEACTNGTNNSCRVLLNDAEMMRGWALMETIDGKDRTSFLCDYFPSYALAAPSVTAQFSNSYQGKKELGKIMTAYEQVDPAEEFCAGMKNHLRHYLANQQTATLTSEEFLALEATAPAYIPENGLIAALIPLLNNGSITIPGVSNAEPIVNTANSLFTNSLQGNYTFEQTEGQVTAVHTDDYVENGLTKTAVETMLVDDRYFMADQTGFPETNFRLTLDARQENLIQLRYASEELTAWFNVARDNEGISINGAYNIKMSTVQTGLQIGLRCNNEGSETLQSEEILINGLTVAACSVVGACEPGTLETPDLSNYQILTVDENGQFNDAMGLKLELYNVARPKLMDIVMSKLPEGAESLTSVLLPLVMQIGQ